MKHLLRNLFALYIINSAIGIEPIPNRRRNISILIIALDNQYYKKIGGYPPESRNAYLSVLNKTKKIKTDIIYFDAAFIRKPTKAEENFARRFHGQKNLVIPAQPSTDETTENYFENADLIGNKIVTSKIRHINKIMRIPGMSFPYREMVMLSRATAVSFSPFEEDYVTKHLPLYANYNGNIYQSVSLVLANMYLKEENIQIEYDSIRHCLILRNLDTHAQIKTLYDFKASDVKIPISFQSKNKTLSAVSFLSQNIDSVEADIVILGMTGDGMSNKILTPIGQISGSQLLAYEINTLIDLVNNTQ